MAIQHLTGATEPRRPDVCRARVVAEPATTGRSTSAAGSRAWRTISAPGARSTSTATGTWPLSSTAPRRPFPRAHAAGRTGVRRCGARHLRVLPTRPARGRCRACSWPASRLPRAPRAGHRGVRVRARGEAEFAERFLHHRTVFPRDFLADYGFRTLRSAGRVELMRLELRGSARDRGRVRRAGGVRAAEIITGPPTVPAPAS